MHSLSTDENNKDELRKYYRNERHLRFSEESWLHILGGTEFTKAVHIAAYLSYGDEPQTTDLIAELIHDGKNIYLPRMLSDKDLEWVRWDGNPEYLTKKGKMFEPIGPALSAVEIQQIEIVIVPALHVDREGNRLGQGGGSYDRALALLPAWRIALVHYGEITSELLPHESFDQRVDAAATPDLIVRFSNPS